MRNLILILMPVFFCPLAYSALADESDPIGACYADSNCRKPLSDQAISATKCGQIARMNRYKRAYLLAEFRDRVVRCGMVYNTIVRPEHVLPAAGPVPLGGSCYPGSSRCEQGTCSGNLMAGYYCL
jgi:hypothetical protein